jgi:molybdopterin converting factor small subunit
MKVCVRLYATLVRLVPETVASRCPGGVRAGVPLEVRLPEGSSLADLVEALCLPRGKVRVCFVNGRAQGLEHILISGDEIGIFPPVGGG